MSRRAFPERVGTAQQQPRVSTDNFSDVDDRNQQCRYFSVACCAHVLFGRHPRSCERPYRLVEPHDSGLSLADQIYENKNE
jgi:hypothetical protein